MMLEKWLDNWTEEVENVLIGVGVAFEILASMLCGVLIVILLPFYLLGRWQRNREMREAEAEPINTLAVKIRGVVDELNSFFEV